ncbi:MAG: nucleotidyltransferase [Pyrinomonadaceae bacterium]
MLLNELNRLVVELENHGIEYAVCGGLAMAIQGFPRATMDIDILIRNESLDRTFNVADQLGFNIRGLDISFADPRVEIRRVSKIIDGIVLSLDLLLVIDEIEEVWNSRERLPYMGREISVVSRDGLVILKKRAGRPQDQADVHRIENEED